MPPSSWFSRKGPTPNSPAKTLGQNPSPQDSPKSTKSTTKSLLHFGPKNAENPRASHDEILQNLRSVMGLLELMNSHEGIRNISKFITDDSIFQFQEQELTKEAFVGELERVWASFPDFALRGGSFEVRADGLIVAHGFIPSGTHTGKPYAFGPYEPIPTSGRRVQNSPETMQFHFRKGKICRYAVVFVDGDMTGPAGLYTQLGGYPLL